MIDLIGFSSDLCWRLLSVVFNLMNTDPLIASITKFPDSINKETLFGALISVTTSPTKSKKRKANVIPKPKSFLFRYCYGKILSLVS